MDEEIKEAEKKESIKKTQEEKKKNGKLILSPKTEATPLKFYQSDNPNGGMGVVINSGEYEEKLKEIVGVKDSELANKILQFGVEGILVNFNNPENEFNYIIQSIFDAQPKDAIEARLAAQASVLYQHGMRQLGKMGRCEHMAQTDMYTNRVMKLFRLHNETIEALDRHRRGGEQKVTVTHAVLANNAIVNNFSGGGVQPKNKGGSPCQQCAEPKQEQTKTSHVDSQQWPMADADCTVDTAPAQKKKAKND